MNLRSSLIDAALRVPLSRNLMIDRNAKEAIAQYYRAAEKNEIDFARLIGVEQVKEILSPLTLSDPVHVIGSGWSLLESRNKIKAQDTVFTCNFGGMYGGKTDLWVVEFANTFSAEFKATSDLQLKVISHSNSPPRAIILKNVWEGKVHGITIREPPYQSTPILKDVYFPCARLWRPGWEDILTNHIFHPRFGFALQFKTSLVFLIQVAYWLGAKNIVMHGLDGGGDSYFQVEKSLIPPSLREDFESVFPRSEVYRPHGASGGIWPWLSAIKRWLNSQGILLHSGSAHSPSAGYLPVWDDSAS